MFFPPRYHSGFDNTPIFGSPVLDSLDQKPGHTESTNHYTDFRCNRTAATFGESDQHPLLALAANEPPLPDTRLRVIQDNKFDIATVRALPWARFKLLHPTSIRIYHA